MHPNLPLKMHWSRRWRLRGAFGFGTHYGVLVVWWLGVVRRVDEDCVGHHPPRDFRLGRRPTTDRPPLAIDNPAWKNDDDIALLYSGHA